MREITGDNIILTSLSASAQHRNTEGKTPVLTDKAIGGESERKRSFIGTKPVGIETSMSHGSECSTNNSARDPRHGMFCLVCTKSKSSI